MIATSRFSIDSNILIYSTDRSDAVRHPPADRIVKAILAAGGPVPLQCLNEFYAVTTKKRYLSPSDAEFVVRKMMTFSQVVPSSQEGLVNAMALHERHHVQFFDALLLATAARAGCTVLFSEDFQDNRTFGPVTLRNPFAMPESELAALLA